VVTTSHVVTNPANILSACRFARLIGYDGGMKFRPRFSLKILLLLVAAIAAFCAYQVNWIQQRHVFLAQHALDAQHFDEAYSQYVPDPTKPRVRPQDRKSWHEEPWAGIKHGEYFSYIGTFPRKTPKRTFNFLWLFGEQRCDQVKLMYRSDSMPTKFLGMRWGGESWALKSIPPQETDMAERLFPEADIRYIVYGQEGPMSH
jgi:hypothetical protein